MREGEIVVVLDADTQFEPRTISRLVRWFADPKVGAVAGNAKVGNRLNMLTRWQALEYVTAQNLERRALAALGLHHRRAGRRRRLAAGSRRRSSAAFRRIRSPRIRTSPSAVQRAGYRSLFDREPSPGPKRRIRSRGLAKQRFRWAFGTLQCLWKHRGA